MSLSLPIIAPGMTPAAAALAWAACGWRVHPCSPQTKRPLLVADVDENGDKIPKSGGLAKASSDAATVAGWWRKWPKAMIGLNTGDDRMFVLDFDPRTDDVIDPDTGEITGTRESTLDDMKAAVEAQIGCALPPSFVTRTQSGGVHLWMRWPDDDGAPIRNRGNLPQHVDVRGAGGYIIAPPSVMATGKEYRVIAARADAGIADAPAALIAVLRDDGRAKAAPPSGLRPATSPPLRGREDRVGSDDPIAAARRRYALVVLDSECQKVSGQAPMDPKSAGRNDQLNASAFTVAALVQAGALSEGMARAAIEAAAAHNPGRDDAGQIAATIASGWAGGLAHPYDLSHVGLKAGSGSRREYSGRADGAGPREFAGQAGGARIAGDPAAGSSSPDPGGANNPTLPNGTTVKPPTAGERAAMVGRGRVWLAARWRGLPDYAGAEGDARDLARVAGERLAFAIGARVAASMIDPLTASCGLWWLAHRVGGETSGNGAKVHRAAQDGLGKPADARRWLTDLRAADIPLTDMGNAERFVARFGGDYRYTTAKGWLGWDEKRWRILDQEQDSTPAEVMAAVFATVRAIQDEATAISDSGFASEGFGGRDRWVPKGKTAVAWSSIIAAHGRASEGSGRLSCIASLAKRWLTVAIEDFDSDPFAINCNNGTLRLARVRRDNPAAGEPRWAVTVQLTPHDRADLIAKLAPVDYHPDAPAPLYDAMMLWAQPLDRMRRYLHQWGGYSASGHVGEQKLQFWYGRGANAKSTVIDAWAGALGDYAGTIQIDTFLDQGLKKRGDAATPDLARLGGVRMLRASEPERNSKLNEALVKAATGGEPMAVRALHKGFFDLRPQFKLTIGGNYRPDVPGTDEGIWRRIKLVPWDAFLEENARDEDLPKKLQPEYSGIFGRLIAGLVDWMGHGFAEPDEVREATADYRSDSDPLARFLSLCTETAPGERVQSSHLYALFCAWAKAAGETEWKQKGFTQAMKAKGFQNKASNGMQFLDLRTTHVVGDFIDADGKVIPLDAAMTGGEGEAGTNAADAPDAAPDGRPFAPARAPLWTDDDDPLG